MNTECFSLLVNHTDSSILSSISVSEDVWKARILIENSYRKENGIYEFTMTRKVGGKYDGVWFCDQILASDDMEGHKVYGVI